MDKENVAPLINKRAGNQSKAQISSQLGQKLLIQEKLNDAKRQRDKQTNREKSKRPPPPVPQEVFDKGRKVRYRVGDRLGSGAFASVYVFKELGRPSNVTKTYAGKCMSKQNLSRSNRQAVQEELRVLKNVKNSYILGFISYSADANYIYFITELCDEGDLKRFLPPSRRDVRNYMKEHNQLNSIKFLYILEQILKGLYYLHSCGYVHRDIKPANILLKYCPGSNTGQRESKINKTFEGRFWFYRIKIADFGLTVKETRTKGSICGTPNYISPEVWSGKGYSLKVDIWAVGCMIFEFMFGQAPFTATDREKIKRKVRREDVQLDNLESAFQYYNSYPSENDEMEEYITGLKTVYDYAKKKKNPADRISVDVLCKNIKKLTIEKYRENILDNIVKVVDKAVVPNIQEKELGQSFYLTISDDESGSTTYQKKKLMNTTFMDGEVILSAYKLNVEKSTKKGLKIDKQRTKTQQNAHTATTTAVATDTQKTMLEKNKINKKKFMGPSNRGEKKKARVIEKDGSISTKFSKLNLDVVEKKSVEEQKLFCGFEVLGEVDKLGEFFSSCSLSHVWVTDFSPFKYPSRGINFRFSGGSSGIFIPQTEDGNLFSLITHPAILCRKIYSSNEVKILKMNECIGVENWKYGAVFAEFDKKSKLKHEERLVKATSELKYKFNQWEERKADKEMQTAQQNLPSVKFFYEESSSIVLMLGFKYQVIYKKRYDIRLLGSYILILDEENSTIQVVSKSFSSLKESNATLYRLLYEVAQLVKKARRVCETSNST
eukprot:snap_masked-scaffold_2-processed-gene-20.2-mRNA-1 protein AED:0.45 eAED:0.45 QI:0/0/0/0.5/1/1/2/0/776